MAKRIESDSLGTVEVDADRYWGAQTQRSLENFLIGRERMPPEIIEALALVKKSAALVNARAGQLPEALAQALAQAADEVIEVEVSTEK